MAKYTLRFRAVNRDIFLDIKSGKKTVETRAATEKYGNIKAGDTLVLICGKEKLEKEVKKATIFKSVKSLVSVYPIKKIMPRLHPKKDEMIEGEARPLAARLSTEKELEGAYYSYPSYKEKIKKNGLIALELK